MPYSVRCKACSSAFAIPDEIWDKRVRGRVATLKCRACRAEIQVDGTKEGVTQISGAPPPAESRPSSPRPMEEAAVAKAAPSSPALASPASQGVKPRPDAPANSAPQPV